MDYSHKSLTIIFFVVFYRLQTRCLDIDFKKLNSFPHIPRSRPKQRKVENRQLSDDLFPVHRIITNRGRAEVIINIYLYTNFH